MHQALRRHPLPPSLLAPSADLGTLSGRCLAPLNPAVPCQCSQPPTEASACPPCFTAHAGAPRRRAKGSAERNMPFKAARRPRLRCKTRAKALCQSLVLSSLPSTCSLPCSGLAGLAARPKSSLCLLSQAGGHPRSMQGKTCGKAANVREKAGIGLASTTACEAGVRQALNANETGRAQTPCHIDSQSAFALACQWQAQVGPHQHAWALGPPPASGSRRTASCPVPSAAWPGALQTARPTQPSPHPPLPQPPHLVGEFAAPLGSGHSICTGR